MFEQLGGMEQLNETQVTTPNEDKRTEAEKTEDKIIADISSITGVVYSDEQRAILKHHGGMAILAAAGSGKTTVLTHLIAKRVMSGEIRDTRHLLCSTYSKAGADEMEERLNALFKKLSIHNKVAVKTLHAFYLLILKHFGYNLNLIDGGQRTALIRKACKDCEVSLSDEDMQTLDSLLSYQVNNLMSDKQLVSSYVYTLENLKEEKYSEIHNSYIKAKKAQGLMDFDDMQLYVYFWLCRADQNTMAMVRNYVHSEWEDFYIDEAQDLSKIQMAILRFMCTDSSKIVFIGDDDQCIYQWRGADPSLITNITGYYDIEKFILSTNYRCKSEIVNTAAVGIKFNTNRTDKTMVPNLEGGDIKIVDTTAYPVNNKAGRQNLYDMTKYAYLYIKDLIKNKGVKPSDIAVLSRNNQHLAILNNMLFKDGIYSKYSKDMRFTTSSFYKELNSLLQLALDGVDPINTANCLWRLVPYLSARTSKIISNFQENTSLRFSDTLGYILTNVYKDNIGWSLPDCRKMPASATAQLNALRGKITSDQVDVFRILYKAMTYEGTQGKEYAEYRRISNLFGLYLTTVTGFLYKTEDRRRTVEGYVEYIKSLVLEFGLDKTLKFLNITTQYENGSMAVFDAQVEMSTMHGAKGKEWEHVILFGDDNITFPSFEGIVNLKHRGIEDRDVIASLEEDRRLHYVAMTRAKTHLAIFTNSDNMSVFTLEALGLFDRGKYNNVDIITMAEQGSLSEELKKKAKEQVFTKESKYYLEIDPINNKVGGSLVDIASTEKGTERVGEVNTIIKSTEQAGMNTSIGGGMVLSLGSDEDDIDPEPDYIANKQGLSSQGSSGQGLSEQGLSSQGLSGQGSIGQGSIGQGFIISIDDEDIYDGDIDIEM